MSLSTLVDMDGRDGRKVEVKRVGQTVKLGRIVQDKFGQNTRVIGKNGKV